MLSSKWSCLFLETFKIAGLHYSLRVCTEEHVGNDQVSYSSVSPNLGLRFRLTDKSVYPSQRCDELRG